jgi:hypothetical protein
MSGVFRNIDTPPPHRPALRRGEDTFARGRGGGVFNSSEDARHCSVLYICKYFVGIEKCPRGPFRHIRH